MLRFSTSAKTATTLVTVLGLGLGSAGGADWPQWRGPDRSGVSRETGLASSWPEGGPRLVWKVTGAGQGYSSVAVVAGRVEVEDAEHLLAFDAADGHLLWKLRIGADFDDSRGGGPRSTPTVVGDRLFVLGAGGDLWSVSLDGKGVWHVPILERFKTENITWGLSESPLVDGDKVIVATGSAKGSIVAFDRKTGEVVWQSGGLKDEPGYASAIAVDVGGVRQVVHFTAQAAAGVRLSDGAVLWRHAKAANRTANCTTPVFDGDRVFVTSAYDTGGALLELKAEGKSTSAREVYFTRDMQNHHGGVVLVGGQLYGFSDSILTCIDFATGEPRWRERSVGKGSLIAADGKLFLLSESAVVGLVEATPAGYRELGRFTIERDSRPSWAHPALADGRLYIRNGDAIYCYDVKAP